MLLHEKTTKHKIANSSEAQPIFLHESKLSFTLQVNRKEWELDLDYFKTVYEQLLSLATKGNMKNGPRKNQLKSQLFKMECLIKEDTQSLIERMDTLSEEFRSSAAPKLGTIFQEYADLEEEFQQLRNEFRKITVNMLQEINIVCPVKIY